MSNGSTSGNNSPYHSNKKWLSLTLKKDEIDRANKDKTNKFYSPNFKVRKGLSRRHSVEGGGDWTYPSNIPLSTTGLLTPDMIG